MIESRPVAYNASHRVRKIIIVILRPLRTPKDRVKDHRCSMKFSRMVKTLRFLCGR